MRSPFTDSSHAVHTSFVQYSLTFRSVFADRSFSFPYVFVLIENVSGTEEKRRDLGCYAKQKGFFYTTAVANKKRDMFVVLYFNWHDDIIHKAMASEANTKWRGGVGVNPKKRFKNKNPFVSPIVKTLIRKGWGLGCRHGAL